MTTKKTDSKTVDTNQKDSSEQKANASKPNASMPDKNGATVKTQIDDFKHGFHMVEEQLVRLQSEIMKDNSSDPEKLKSLKVKADAAQKLIADLKDKVAAAPEIAHNLGVGIDRPVVVEKEFLKVVRETKLNLNDVVLEMPKGVAQQRMTGIGPRDAKLFADNTMTPIQMIGKLRLQFDGEDGRPAPNATYALQATLKDSDEKIQLRSGKTDSRGYTSVNLSNIELDSIDKVEVIIHDASIDKLKPHIYTLSKARIFDGLMLAVPHIIPVPRTLVEKLHDWMDSHDSTETPGTIEDPDDIDLSISPASFGLNEEHIDGNCCLRPRTEFPAKEYYFRQTVRLTDIEDVRLVFNGLREKERTGVAAPIDYGNDSASTYAVLGGNLLIGLSNLYRHGWYPAGRGLGRLLYSTSLAPCEDVNLAFIDWTRSERDTRSESRTQTEQMEHDLQHDRSIDEVVDSLLTENQEGGSIAGGGGASLDLGFFSIGGGGGGTSSSSSGRRSLHTSTVQNISDSVSQSASAIRHQRSTVVTTSFQRESERIETRTVHNHNMNHVMNLQYFQVVEHYSVKTELVEEKPVLLVPYAIDQAIFGTIASFAKFVNSPSNAITRFLDRHSTLLRRMVPSSYRSAFQSLSRLLHCKDVYSIEAPYATFSRWDISLGSAWRLGVSLRIKTKSGQTLRLSPRGHTSNQPPSYFVSSPVRHDDVSEFIVSFDSTEALRNINTINLGFFSLNETAFGDAIKFKLDRIEVYATTDRSRYISNQQSFVIETNAVDVTLDATNPSVNIGIATNPPVDFSSYRGREHSDYCRLQELIAHIQSEPMRYMRAIWLREDSDRRAIRFDQFKIGNKSLLDHIVNKPIGILGNYVAFEVLEGHRIAAVKSPDYVVSSRVVTIPTRGVFGEVFLSCCNATEKRDIERFIEPENRCQRTAPDITGVSPGSRASRSDTTPTSFAAPIINLQTAPAVPDPSAMTNALSVMGTPDIFRDLSNGAELLSFINNATKEAFTSTRQHRAAMDAIAGDVVRGLVSAYTGVPITSSGSAAPADAKTDGITKSTAGTNGSKPNKTAPISAKVNNPSLQAASNEMVRQTSPAKLIDQLQVIKKAKDSGLLTEAESSRRATQLLGEVDDQNVIIPASNISYGVVAEPLGTASREVDIKLRVFIPAPVVSTGIPLTSAYAGDDRSFSYSGGSSRAEIHAKLTFGSDHAWPQLQIDQIEFGATHAYDQGDTSDVAGKPSWWNSINSGASPTGSGTLSRTADNLNAVQSYTYAPTAESYWPDGPIAALVYLKVNAPNPLESLAPAIDTNLYLYVKQYNDKLYYKLSGDHDGFPAFELYVDECLVFSHDPAVENQSPASLLPPSEYKVGETGITSGWSMLPCDLGIFI